MCLDLFLELANLCFVGPSSDSFVDFEDISIHWGLGYDLQITVQSSVSLCVICNLQCNLLLCNLFREGLCHISICCCI